MGKFAFALLMLSLLLSTAAQAQRAAPVEELREVEGERSRLEFLLRQLNDREAEVLEVLEDAQERARAAQEEAENASERRAQAEVRLNSAKEREAELLSKRRELEAAMAPRLVLRHRLSRFTPLQLLATSGNLSEWLWQRRMLSKVLQGDLAQAAELAELENQVREARAGVEKEQALFSAAEEDARNRAQKALLEEQTQRALLQAARSQRSIHERRIAELEKARQKLLTAIAAMPSTPPGLGGFGGRRSTLPHPVKGRVEVGFGPRIDPQFGTVTHHKGVDIRAPLGQPVRCPHPARVGFAGPFRGYGNLVILDHGEAYYTLYAHLDRIWVEAGEALAEGDILGTVGQSGSLKGPFLYFEIRSGARALDPAEWLKPNPTLSGSH